MAGVRSAEPEPVEVDVDEIEDVTDAVEPLDDAALFAAQLATQEFSPPTVAAPPVEPTTREVDTPALPMPASFAPTPWVEDNTLPTPPAPAMSLPAPLPPRGFESLAPLPLDPAAQAPASSPSESVGYGLGEDSADGGSATKTAVANVADLKRQIAEMTRLDPEDTPLAGDPLAGSGFESLEPSLGVAAEAPIDPPISHPSETPAGADGGFSVELPVSEPLSHVPQTSELAGSGGDADEPSEARPGAPLPPAFMPADDTISEEGVPPAAGPTVWPGSDDAQQGLPPAFDDPASAFAADEPAAATSVTDLLAAMPPPADEPPVAPPAAELRAGLAEGDGGVPVSESNVEVPSVPAAQAPVAPAVVFPAVPEGSSTPSSLFDASVQAAKGAHTQPEEDLQQIVSVARGQTRRFVAAAAVVAIGMVAAAYLATQGEHAPRFAFASEVTMLRPGPTDSDAYPVIGALVRGERVQVVETNGPRALVRDALQRVGYVAAAALVDHAPALVEGEPFYACVQAPLDGGPTTCQARATAQRDACRLACAGSGDATRCNEGCDDRFVRCDAGCAAVLQPPEPTVAAVEPKAAEPKPAEAKPGEAAPPSNVGADAATGVGQTVHATAEPAAPLTKAQARKLEREKRRAAAKEARLAKQAKAVGTKKKQKAVPKAAPGVSPAPSPSGASPSP